ncbi:hypothetical protein BS50DRAFT_671522 [Corynespora cassiicola Philippines]|uniref:Transcription-associated protein 1 n=1 Tax=Corynespora cassiicola Philippines TaxID=1448308 RepID=A0A2T2PCT3_CORCC|nr:hypothetical protein BS50DRAFT_671522 [Corynespora cassiicola Philippines]
MAAHHNFETMAAKLDDPNSDLRAKGAQAIDIRDNIESYCQGPQYSAFLNHLVPVFLKILEGEPVFISTSPDQRIRNCVLEILHRLPMNPIEAVEPHAAKIVDKLMSLVKIENEDNAVLCMKTIMDFQRHQTKALADRVQPFLDLIQEMFETMEQAVQQTFDDPAPASAAHGIPSTPGNHQYSQSPRPASPATSLSSGPAGDIGAEHQQTRRLLRGMQSFKVLAECPIIVVSLFQAYRNCVNKNVKLFVPLIKNVLLLQAKPQEKAHQEAESQGKIFTGVSKEIQNRAAFGDFITAQVKTMSFLAYLLRMYAQQLNDFLPTLPDIVVRLLKDCPREKSGARKELLVAIRHIINFNFRKIFLKKIDELLDERTLIGDGLTVYETMRPLAYSMLADLIHHLRDSLSKEQIRRTVEVYTKNLHDTFPGTSFQTMSAKLLLNMAECIAKLESKEDARYFLIMILNAIGDKFAAMNRQYHNAVKLSAQYSQPSIDAVEENHMAVQSQPPDWDEIDIFNATPIKTSNPRDRSSDPIADNKFLFKNLLHGLKNLFYQLRACNPAKIKDEIDAANASANWHEVSFGYNAEEVEVLIKLFREGAKVFRYYGTDKPSETQNLSPGDLMANQHMMSSGKEEKELLETFATVFHHIDPATFHEVFSSEIPHLYDMMFDHPALLHVPQFLLASEATSPSFAGMLLRFLMDRIEEVGTADVKKSSILLRLFKLSFMAVTLFSAQNEQVLLPHVSKIITRSIQLSTTAEEPMNYFLLLRSLFRSIGGGRFEHLYKEILPLLEMLLDVLNNLLLTARRPAERDLFVELSLTVPARLSNLLPHLSYLMRPLVVALRAGSDLVGQGLRTLELCVDNLTADYLDPIMAPVIDELMAALWEHLKPNPYSHFHAHTTMRILGKLGGRNRKFITGPPDLEFKPYADDQSSVDIRLIGSTKDRAFPADIGIDHAIVKLHEVPKLPAAKKSDAFHKQQAFRLITAHTKMMIGFDALPDDFAQLVRLQANDLFNKKTDVGTDLLTISERDRSITKKTVEQETLKKLLKACIFAVSIPDLKADAEALVINLARHFTLLELGSHFAQIKHRGKPFDVRAGEGPVCIESDVMSEAIGDSLASEHLAVREAAEQAVLTMRDAAKAIFGDQDKLDRFPFFEELAKTFCHNCHAEDWFMKSGGTRGIEIVTKKLGLGTGWMIGRHFELIRALNFVMKDMPVDLDSKTRVQAEGLLADLIKRCHKTTTKEEFEKPNNQLLRLCGQLVGDLSHPNKNVRDATQKAFHVLSEVTGLGVHELIIPVKDRLVVPIWTKPLRALPFSIQIAYIDAITFCLKLKNNILEFNEQLTRLLMESLALADADDEGLATKPYEQRNADYIVNLRVACIRLLSTAQSFPEFSTTPPNQTFLRIIAVFFKCLYSKSNEVIEAANQGLSGVISATNKLPKDVLQSGLRPILVNLQDPRKLTVENLDGLARLLKLLTNYFKVEIGTRLLDHLKSIADPVSLQKISFTMIEQHQKMKIVTGIFNIFHLLPSAAATFLKQITEKVIELETALRRTRNSPFREPLIKYLCIYPKEAWEYFSPNLKDQTQGRFFAQLLEDPASGALRKEVMNDIPKFLESFQFEGSEKEVCQAELSAIHIAYAMSKFDETSNWLVSHENLRKALFDAARSLERKLHQNTIDPELRLATEQAGEQIMHVFTSYLKHEPSNLDFFFELIDAITSEELKQSPQLFDFIYGQMISSDSVEYWKTLVHKCIDLYTGRASSQKTKTFIFRYIVNPIFAMDVKRNWDSLFGQSKGTKLMDRAMTETIHKRLWQPQALTDMSEDLAQLGVDHSRMELLQLTTLLLKHYSGMVQEARKDVIRFAWNYIKLEDIINKYAAYVLIAFFIAVYDTPAKIAMQVYQALLKAHQNEGRSLVMQALELMAPVLSKRMGGDAKMPIPRWAQLPRKILAEESSNLQQLMSIFNFLVRHPDLFYEARDPLSSIIITALPKIAQPPNPSTEAKKLALNLISLIRTWEERTANESGSAGDRASQSPQAAKRKADGTIVPSANQSKGFVASPGIRMMLIKYLIQFIAYLPERYPVAAPKPKDSTPAAPSSAQPAEICKKAVQLLHDLLSARLWGDLDLDIMLTKKIEEILLAEMKQEDKPDPFHTRMINTLQIVKVIVNVKPDDWVLQRVPHFQKILDKPIRSENADVQASLHTPDENEDGTIKLQPILKRILEVMPEPVTDEEGNTEDTPSTEFVNFLGAVATEALSNGSYISAINILWTLCQKRPEEIDQHIPQIMKAFQGKMAKDHLAAHSGMPGQPGVPPGMRPEGANPPTDPREIEVQTDLVLKVIDVLASRMNELGENRRPYLSVLASLVERSQSNTVCMKVLDLVEEWIFRSTEPVPTLKEKTAVLSKMLLFEHRPDTSLLTRFLDLVIRIYEDPKITRSELTVRMEHAFLIGTRAQDVEMRNRYMTIFDKSLSRTASSRLSYVLASQNWDTLSDSYWLSQVIHLMFGSIEMNAPAQLHPEDFKLLQASTVFGTYSKDSRIADVMVDDELENLISAHRRFCSQLGDVKVKDIFEPLGHLQHTDSNLAHNIWVSFFPLAWTALTKDDQADLEKGIAALLTKDYHSRQIDKRPNCVSTMLDAIASARPRVKFPPHIMKFLARTYNAWYTAAVYMEESAVTPIVDTEKLRESNLDALLEIYGGLQEDDLFYGTWRRRCQFIESNAALSYEQCGIWDKAQQMYEAAQIKARTSVLPFSSGEYMLWEDHWVLCAQKLQQWEVLSDFAKHENFNDLYLEATWRHFDAWQNAETREQLDATIKAVGDAPTPRRVFFQTFMSLLKLHAKLESQPEFHRLCDESIQLSIRKWHQLPRRITQAHIPLLQHFQQLVELHDASVICQSLAQTTQANLDHKSQELKLLLSTWRDRLPNFWDDINAWQDLVTWRQHIFHLINSVYLQLLPPNQNNASGGNSFAYRGYHETAWIINRFAHVARKHNLPEVCIQQLSRIYTLPNIEIQEAFLKLREQAKCHYQNRAELNNGLDVINNTNLNYFGPGQKAEFYTLKGMFLAKLGQKNEANDAFGYALFFDIKLPKAWSEWGHYNDMLFKEDPSNMEKAEAALSCYLEAASQFKNAKSRKLLGRVLWLLSLDTPDRRLAEKFEEFKGDTPAWYWITYIPQLLNSLSRPEASIARQILGKLAKTYPQALYCHLRTTREDMALLKKTSEQREAKEKAARAKQQQQAGAQGSPAPKQGSPDARPGSSGNRPTSQNGENKPAANSTANGTVKTEGGQQGTPATETPPPPKKPWDHVEEISAILKTAFPLLALSMETMLDQIQKNFKCPPDEDAYRLIVALLNDGLSYVGRQPNMYAQEVRLPTSTEANITRFAESVLPPHIRKAFELDFVKNKPTMYEYIQKLRIWRNRFEERLDRRKTKVPLENYTHQLSEFRFLKFDDVEVPGQYLQHRDKNSDFVRIERFLPEVDLVRGIGMCHRRLKIRGHDGSVHPFAIQFPAARSSRREERILQLFRIFNGILSKRKESRRRNLQFHLPLMVPITPSVRMVQDDESYVNMQGIFEDYCRRNGINKDEPVLFSIEKLRALQPKNLEHANSIRLETFAAVQEKYVPQTVVLDYFKSTYPSFDDFWLFRRTFSYQLATLTFMTYVMHMNTRFPHKMNISRGTGRIWGTELIPSMAVGKPILHNNEPVPFRLTPNLQTMLGPLNLEGIFAPAVMTVARCLIEPEGELEMQLAIFMRDEMNHWFTSQHKQLNPQILRESVQANSDIIVKRATSLGTLPGAPNVPANQTMVDLVSDAVHPQKLSQTDPLWMAYL